MPMIELRAPGSDGSGQWISYTSSTSEETWVPTTSSQAVWTSYTTGFVTSYTTTTECDCDYETTTTTSSWCPPTTTSLVPAVTTTSPSSVVVVNEHHHGGLSPGAVGGIVLGVFFGVLLLFLLCICCFRNWRRRPYYGSDSSSSSSSRGGRRRKPPVVIIDPYPRRPEANLTFVGGGNYPGTRVMVTKTQKTFIRPPPVKQVRTYRETRRTEKIVVVDDDD